MLDAETSAKVHVIGGGAPAWCRASGGGVLSHAMQHTPPIAKPSEAGQPRKSASAKSQIVCGTAMPMMHSTNERQKPALPPSANMLNVARLQHPPVVGGGGGYIGDAA